eukprot:TRINITY_DN446_c0_g2_i1.p1 TRINITY_DN446_c0_g2~~TRINITY_DN446_c0_g2_i1.p1  ORF type:complete len:202 (-),score=26.57 TRINITY_DN446_c0_g2_i1:100-705(-)
MRHIVFVLLLTLVAHACEEYKKTKTKVDVDALNNCLGSPTGSESDAPVFSNGLNTGLKVVKGRKYTISAKVEDTWSLQTDLGGYVLSNAVGVTSKSDFCADLYDSDPQVCDKTAATVKVGSTSPSLPAGTLVYTIGDGETIKQVFKTDKDLKGKEITAAESGTLYFYSYDYYCSNNGGSIEVTITSTSNECAKKKKKTKHY